MLAHVGVEGHEGADHLAQRALGRAVPDLEVPGQGEQGSTPLCNTGTGGEGEDVWKG